MFPILIKNILCYVSMFCTVHIFDKIEGNLNFIWVYYRAGEPMARVPKVADFLGTRHSLLPHFSDHPSYFMNIYIYIPLLPNDTASK
jgi:hypothetical protein